jgi:nitrite reductase/ring-hydroxylating ferredoxin subunit
MAATRELWLQAPLEELTARGRLLLESRGRSIAVFYVDGEIHAFENACPHAGNPLIEGEVLGRTLVCAFHSWRFDLESGACLLGERPVRRYRVEKRGTEIWIDLRV